MRRALFETGPYRGLSFGDCRGGRPPAEAELLPKTIPVPARVYQRTRRTGPRGTWPSRTLPTSTSPAAGPAGAATRSWDWRSGDCGGSPGGLLGEEVIPVQPGSQVCVLPPSYDMAFGPRVYVGTYIDDRLFVQTSSPDPRCAPAPGPTVRVRSDQICSADPARQPGVITYEPATAPPPPPVWDFTHTQGDPRSPQARQYIVSTSNAELYFESPVALWKPARGGAALETTSPGVITYRFPFGEPVARAHLFLNMPTFHWSYSRGLNRLYGSRDGASWQLLMEVPTPAFGQANSGTYQSGRLV